MSSEDIARVVHDVRTGNFHTGGKEHQLVEATKAFAVAGPVVDISGIYQVVRDRDYVIDLYEAHTSIVPPWLMFTMVFENKHGNVFVLPSFVREQKEGFEEQWPEGNEDVDWSRVRWVMDSFVVLGGRGGDGKRIPTQGPLFLFQTAVYGDGSPADLHWVDLRPDLDRDMWDLAHQTMLGALNFLNARNVDIVEVQRPRAERRRLERAGIDVKLHTINVFPAGKTRRNAKGEPIGGQPLSPVRGHWACYGEAYGKGKLFGKLEGRFWISPHVRGVEDNGESRPDYKLVPNG